VAVEKDADQRAADPSSKVSSPEKLTDEMISS
jgi:hypothetical protein